VLLFAFFSLVLSLGHGKIIGRGSTHIGNWKSANTSSDQGHSEVSRGTKKPVAQAETAAANRRSATRSWNLLPNMRSLVGCQTKNSDRHPKQAV
jgi:hypothetical protein